MEQRGYRPVLAFAAIAAAQNVDVFASRLFKKAGYRVTFGRKHHFTYRADSVELAWPCGPAVRAAIDSHDTVACAGRRYVGMDTFLKTELCPAERAGPVIFLRCRAVFFAPSALCRQIRPVSVPAAAFFCLNPVSEIGEKKQKNCDTGSESCHNEQRFHIYTIAAAVVFRYICRKAPHSAMPRH